MLNILLVYLSLTHFCTLFIVNCVVKQNNWRAGASQPSRSIERNLYCHCCTHQIKVQMKKENRMSQRRNVRNVMFKRRMSTIHMTIESYWRAGASQPSRSFERKFLYAAVVVRRVSAHARLLTCFFLSEIISKYLHIFTHAASRDMRRSI